MINIRFGLFCSIKTNYELTAQLFKKIRNGDIEDEETEETVEITMKITTNRKLKWSPESIERAFDHYRRDNAYFGLITPEIVRNNWSTIFFQCPKYTGMTLGQFLDRYNSQRSAVWI